MFDYHTLFWDHGWFHKTYKTHSSGLPELLFNSGYSQLQFFTTFLQPYYDNTVHWAFASQSKNKALAQLDKGNAITSNADAGIATMQKNGDVTIDVSLTLTNLVAFLQGMKLRYNDGSGTQDIVTFLSSDFVKDMRLKCKIKLSNDSVILVDPETLNFIENPDIALMPQTSSDYVWDSANITSSHMEHIMYSKALSPLQEEIMSHHTWLHHLPWPKLITMAKAGEIPRCLASLKGRCPICVACLFGTAHKHPWHSKLNKSHPIWKKSDNRPGPKASLDHLVSAQPGLIPQIIGRLICMQVNGATIFVDHCSDHVYIFLMRDLTLDKTILVKHAYEWFLLNLGVTSKAYHADNGCFADKGFWDECTSCHQVITFCGIGGHHQNGIAERIIKELTLGAGTLLLHAKQMLPEYISMILWLFALKCCKDWLINFTHRADGWTPYQTIAGLELSKIILSNFHTFGCPCYVLDHCLQSGNGTIPKWEPRAQMGICVGWLPSHASNIAFVLNPRTGHVSPQFYVVFDDVFTTVPYLCTATVPPHWADLVCSSDTIEIYTEKQIGTWQLILDIEIEQGDFSGKSQPLSTSTQDCEGVEDTTALSNCSNQRVSFADKLGVEQEINHPLLLWMTMPEFGKCQHQSILISVGYVAHQGLKSWRDVIKCTLTQQPSQIRQHTCAWQAHQEETNLPWCYSLLSVRLGTACHVWLTLFRRKLP